MKKKQRFHQYLLDVINTKGAGYLTLIDPDEFPPEKVVSLARRCEQHGSDGILIGGSLLMNYSSGASFDNLLKQIKNNIDIPLFLFPGNSHQISSHADAILFLSLISGRNPNWLIGEHVIAAPIIKKLQIEPISTAYMIVESGTTTSVQFMSNTSPLPRNKIDIALAHALAGEYLGMQLIYLEAGSGATTPIPDAMISIIKNNVSIPVIVGGGIRDPEIARQKVTAGADFIVTGTILEDTFDENIINDFSNAIHET